MGTPSKQVNQGAGAGDTENVKAKESRAFKRARDTHLQRATDVYGYIVDTLIDHGEHILSVKEVNANFTGTRQLLSTVQTVHRLQREASIVAQSPQLHQFSQISPLIGQKEDLRKQKRIADTKGA